MPTTWDPSSLPVLTAIATLIAAGIGAAVALSVAFVNAWSSRRIAIDTPHRQFRSDLASTSVQAARELLHLLYELRSRLDARQEIRDSQAAQAILAPRLKTDFRTPNDSVFEEVIAIFIRRRTEIATHLAFLLTKSPLRAEVLREMAGHAREVCEALELAAEAYVFDLKDVRQRAALRVKALNQGDRLETRLAPYAPDGEPEF